MSVIESVFKDRKAYVAYLTAGDGGLDKTLEIMKAYAESGVDIIEVGVPFTDPVADGPIIQAAAMRALEFYVSLHAIFDIVRKFKKDYSTRVVLFTYLNPLLQHSTLEDSLSEAKAHGIDGCLVVDLPIDEAKEYHDACFKADIDPIYLIAPSTPKNRIKKIATLGCGMLYYACRKGVTGMKSDMPEGFSEKMAEIKSQASLPIVVGFGIASSDTARAILEDADGFVVGSLLVKAAHEENDDTLRMMIKQLDPR